MQLSRREFLGAGLVGVATLAVGVRPATGGQIQTKKVVVGAHPWVYAATQPKYDITPILDQIFADMRYAGMEGIELMHTALRPDDAVERIGELSEKHDLPVIGTSFGAAMWDRGQHQMILEDAELVITRLSELGGRTLGTSVGNAPQKKTPGQLDAQADLLKKVMAVCEDNNVVLNLHNHKYEVEDNQHDLKGTIERISHIKLGPDLDWLVQAGVDPIAFLKEHADRIVFLHLRDQKADKTWVEAMGQGDMDYVAVGKVLWQIGFTGHAVIELAHPRGLELTRPLRESLRISREYVRRNLGY
jgi:sugar phosphate isomerase/epimerase